MIRDILDTLAAANRREFLADLVKLALILGIIAALQFIAFALAPYTPTP